MRTPHRLWQAMILICLGAILGAAPSQAAALKDAESASHADTAATYQVVQVYSYPGYRLVQFNLAVLSHYSYLLVSGKEALAVDPGRDVDAYLEWCKKEGVKITGVFLTHNHADFVAGHLELAKVTGCPIYVSAQAGAAFPHKPLKEGDTIKVGEAVVKILETPGHTPEGLCGLVAHKAKPQEPHLLLTGDTLFIGSVGRPDLMGGTLSAAALAGMLFDTWWQKLSKLPDHLALFPAHGAGSLCGVHLSDEPTSTLGVQKQVNPYLKYRNKGEFIAAVLEGLPTAPQYFRHNAALNKRGPEPVNWQAGPVMLKPEAVLTDPKEFQVVDLRDAKEYAAGHLPNALNIGVRGRLETWVGTMIPWGSRVVVTGSPDQVQEAWRRLHRIGYVVQGLNWEDWRQARLPQAKTGLIPPQELHARMQKGEAPVIVDVRLPQEWQALRIGPAVNLPLDRLEELAPLKLDPEQPVVTVCNSAYRSSLAAGVLQRLGFKQVASLDGGSEAWIAAGLPTLGPEVAKLTAAAATATPASAGPSAPPPVPRDLRLPERLAPVELKRLLVDLPGTFELVDIRPPAAFGDYHLPGARNVDIGELLKDPGYLNRPGALIVVDRDGSVAMAVAGILSQKTTRPIKVLHGGLAAYWSEVEFPSVSGAPPSGTAPAVRPPEPAPAPAAPAPRRRPEESLRGAEMLDTGKPPMNPYLAGVFLGLVLVASYAVLGAGLGASGALARLAAALSHLLAPARTQASAYFGAWAPHYLSYYLVFMFLGILVGGFLSALAAGRISPGLERGPGCPAGKRAFLALTGGVLVGFASRLAQGCTSGQALSGGALLLTGSWIFLAALFLAGFAVARFFRGQWYA